MRSNLAVVTGASQGIGRATAIRLARDFSAIALVARNRDALTTVADQVSGAGAEPLVCSLDLRQIEAPARLVDAVLARYGRIDALLNIAGDVPQVDLFEMTEEQWQSAAELKFHGARRLTIRAREALRAAQGSVIFMSGTAALHPSPASAAIASINAAVSALGKAFAEQGLKDSIQVNSIAPGAVLTDRRRSLLSKWAGAHHMTIQEAIEVFPGTIGIARFGQPEEVADLLAFLVSPSARWLTGATLRMDGGEIKDI